MILDSRKIWQKSWRFRENVVHLHRKNKEIATMKRMSAYYYSFFYFTQQR